MCPKKYWRSVLLHFNSFEMIFDKHLSSKFTEIHSPIASNHWEPYYKVCAPCHMRYDYISHLDPTKEENKFLWDSVGLNSSSFQMSWVNGNLISSEDKSKKRKILLPNCTVQFQDLHWCKFIKNTSLIMKCLVMISIMC